MSFGVDFLMGLGRGAQRAREDQKAKEIEERELREQTQKRSLEFLGKLIDTDNLLPDEARNVAAQHYFRLAMNPKAKEGDFERAVKETMAIANMPRTPATARNMQIDQAKQTDDARQVNDVDYGALMAGSPGMMAPFGLAVREAGRAANMMMPTREEYGPLLGAPKDTYRGFLSRDEIMAREEEEMRRRLRITRDLTVPKTSTVEGHDGIYTFDQTGKNIGFTPFRTSSAKTGNLSDFEGHLERKIRAWQAANPGKELTPDIEYALSVEARKEYGQADDRPPHPLPAYFQSEPLVPVWDADTQQVIYTPRSQAAGKPAPRTTYDERGLPTTGGVPGVSLSPPLPVSEGTQEVLRGFDVLEAQLQGVEPLIQSVQTGPLWGRISKVKVNQLGGVAASPKEQEMIVRLRRLLSSQAFAEGGKQLTGTEKAEFEAIVPKPEDTVEQALIKVRLTREFVKNKRAATLRYLPPRQSAQIPSTAAPVTTPPARQFPATKALDRATAATYVKRARNERDAAGLPRDPVAERARARQLAAADGYDVNQ